MFCRQSACSIDNRQGHCAGASQGAFIGQESVSVRFRAHNDYANRVIVKLANLLGRSDAGICCSRGRRHKGPELHMSIGWERLEASGRSRSRDSLRGR